MIKSLKVTNHLGESITIAMGSPALTGLSIRGLDGLGPPKANINTTDVGTLDGSYFNSSRAQSRNIVVTLGFEYKSDETIEQLRLKTYKYFPIKKQITLEVETDTRTVKVSGYVESNIPTIFSKDEVTVISIICPDAYLYGTTATLTEFTSVHPLFEFPFSNESLTDPLLEFGDLVITNQQIINYPGEAEVGFVIDIKAIGNVTDLTIFNVVTGESMFIDTGKLTDLTGDPIIAGDEILISTIKGDKYIYLLRNGLMYNILNCLTNSSVWFQLKPGENVFSYLPVTGLTNMTFEIINNVLYEGV